MLIVKRLGVRLIIMQHMYLYVCMYVCVYVCMYICHTLISMGSLVTCVYRHDVHVVTLTLRKYCVNGPCWTLSSLYATVLEHKRESEGQLHHKKAGQRRGNMIE